MKEIGEKLKQAREEQGVSIDEAAGDLSVKPNQIENIEEGNVKAFKDVFYLKCFIRDYSKYLGFKSEDIMDEFNEYLYQQTSKISIEEIEKASQEKQKEKNQEKKVASPYTIDEKPKSKFVTVIVILIILLLLSLIGYVVVTKYVLPDEDNEVITYLEN